MIITGQGAGVTSYMECSAREYSRTSIISDSDISPYDTELVRRVHCQNLELFQPPKVETIRLLLLPIVRHERRPSQVSIRSSYRIERLPDWLSYSFHRSSTLAWFRFAE